MNNEENSVERDSGSPIEAKSIFKAFEHPIAAGLVLGLGAALATPFASRYAEVQRTISLRSETVEEVVQYSATVENAFRIMDQAGQQVARHRLKGDALLPIEERLQEQANRILTAQHVLDAHVAFRFRNPEVQRLLNIQRDSVRNTLNVLVSLERPLSERQGAMKIYWDTNLGQLNDVLLAMGKEINPSAFRVYRFVILGNLFSGKSN